MNINQHVMKKNIKNHFVVNLIFFRFAAVTTQKHTTMNKKTLYQ
jgi:hypothetical protein